MSSYQLDELKQQVTDLTAAEMRQLASYLLGKAEEIDQTPPSPISPLQPEHKRELVMQWLKAHRSEYGGKYVALDGDRLLAVGATYREVVEAAQQSGVINPFIDYVSPPDGVGFGGW